MQIDLKDVIPSYFEKNSITNSEVWGKTLSFIEGSHVNIVAPSGSGKTSLIHFIYGMRKDYTGIVSYDNISINDFGLDKFSSFRQTYISIVFQDMRLFADLYVRQNIEIKRQLAPFHPAEKIDEMANRLGIGNKLERITNTCSYGEKQRVAIIRSLMQPFKFLLLDEPFSNLDDLNRAKAMELIAEECATRNASMIFADLKKVDFFEGQRILRL